LGQKNEKAPADAAEAQKLQNKTNYGKNLEFKRWDGKGRKIKYRTGKNYFFFKRQSAF
jgi:hypothetical protein